MHIQAISRKSQARLHTLARVSRHLAPAAPPRAAPGAIAEILGVALMLAVFLTAAIIM